MTRKLLVMCCFDVAKLIRGMLVPVLKLQLCCCRLGKLAESLAYNAWFGDHVSAGLLMCNALTMQDSAIRNWHITEKQTQSSTAYAL